MTLGKKLYSNGDYFGAREEFYAADAYGSNEAEYWIGLCNQHLKPVEPVEPVEEGSIGATIGRL